MRSIFPSAPMARSPLTGDGTGKSLSDEEGFVEREGDAEKRGEGQLNRAILG